MNHFIIEIQKTAKEIWVNRNKQQFTEEETQSDMPKNMLTVSYGEITTNEMLFLLTIQSVTGVKEDQDPTLFKALVMV